MKTKKTATKKKPAAKSKAVKKVSAAKAKQIVAGGFRPVPRRHSAY